MSLLVNAPDMPDCLDTSHSAGEELCSTRSRSGCFPNKRKNLDEIACEDRAPTDAYADTDSFACVALLQSMRSMESIIGDAVERPLDTPAQIHALDRAADYEDSFVSR